MKKPKPEEKCDFGPVWALAVAYEKLRSEGDIDIRDHSMRKCFFEEAMYAVFGPGWETYAEMKNIPEMGAGGYNPVVSVRTNSKGIFVSRGPFERPIELTIIQACDFARSIDAAIAKVKDRDEPLEEKPRPRPSSGKPGGSY